MCLLNDICGSGVTKSDEDASKLLKLDQGSITALGAGGFALCVCETRPASTPQHPPSQQAVSPESKSEIYSSRQCCDIEFAKEWVALSPGLLKINPLSYFGLNYKLHRDTSLCQIFAE